MNWKKHLFYLTTLAMVSACDSFVDDVAPQGEDELVLQDAISALPNTSLFIDLKTLLRSSEAVKFSIGSQPGKGTASIDDKSILLYQPKVDFVTGQDVLSINLINTAGTTIDTDSIWINMASSADSIPCLNGALADYYYTEVNQPVIIQPILNDGYCADKTSGAILNFTESPTNGTIEQVELFTYRYTPNVDFVGDDAFMYELTLVDEAGEEHYSISQVNVAVFQDTTSHYPCDSLIQPIDYYITSDSVSASYMILVYQSDPFCGDLDHQLEIVSVASGSATVYDPSSIQYFPGSDTIDFIEYSIHFEDGHSVDNYVTIYFDYSTDDPSDSICGIAHDDDYNLFFVADSIGTELDPFILDPVTNDEVCGQVDLRIIEAPTIGTASLYETNQIAYYVSEEFAGTMETQLLYEICDHVKCDTAMMTLSVTK
ncbi:MAG: hypothetical protein RIC35_22290 [Marinoscillum sp.]